MQIYGVNHAKNLYFGECTKVRDKRSDNFGERGKRGDSSTVLSDRLSSRILTHDNINLSSDTKSVPKNIFIKTKKNSCKTKNYSYLCTFK